MTEWNEIIGEQLHWFVLAFGVLILLLLIISIVQGAKLRSVRKKYNAMMAGTGVENLEGLLIELRNQTDELQEGQALHQEQLKSIQGRITGMKSNVAIKRYNAFGERGHDLSFSIAIVDDGQNGVVVTSLHNRENAYVYAKPLEKGESAYALSPEEKEVIAQALRQT